ncbi:hypothetical protein ACVWZ8_005031 [Arthrobacter sp. UYCu723]
MRRFATLSGSSIARKPVLQWYGFCTDHAAPCVALGCDLETPSRHSKLSKSV